MFSSTDKLAVNTIRILSAEAIQKAKSGHPGLPMGAAPMAYTLYSRHLKFNPADPQWPNRDRFVLSSGHGSMLLYSLLHIFGFGLDIEEIKNFRQFGSLTPGHPEYKHTKGVEVSTGPLGMGLGNAVGMAMAERYLAAQFNRENFPIVDHYTYALCGDGCLMEGISHEACSLAGTLKLNKLIVLYDDNDISIEGSTDLAFTEDVPTRFKAYGWQVLKVNDGNDMDAINGALRRARQSKDKPTLIVIKTQIGYGCPAKAGTASVHGEPLGEENLKATKEFLGWPYPDAFHVPDEIALIQKKALKTGAKVQSAWNKLFAAYKATYPDLAAKWELWQSGRIDYDFRNDEEFWMFASKAATRASSGETIARITKHVENFVGGSADLAPSNKTYVKGRGDFSAPDYSGSNFHFGVREFAMGAIANGMAVHGGLRPYVGTFFVFSDYMKHAIRLAAMMQLPVTYVFTHDSIGVGEDGPTHEPVEQLAALRSIPGMTSFRPCDAREVAVGYLYALDHKCPTAMILTRQDLPLQPGSSQDAAKGAYVISPSQKEQPDAILIASGSEVDLCIKAQAQLREKGVDARVVSMPSMEVFERQSEEYKASVLPKSVRARVCVEALSGFGWDRYAGLDGKIIAMQGYGLSAPYAKLFPYFGFTVENVVEKALEAVNG